MGMTLRGHLGHLETSGLIRRAAEAPDREYLFRHALIQDAAYASLLRQDRRRLHRAVAETLEALYPDQRDDLAALLAEHFAEAGDDARALTCFTQAADHAARRYANAEAIALYAEALAVARRLEPAADTLIPLYTHQGRALELHGRYPEAWALYAEMEALAGVRGDARLELAALLAGTPLLITYTPFYDPAAGQARATRAFALAQALDDRAAEAIILWHLMLAYGTERAYLAQSIRYGEQSLALARELGLREQEALTLNDLAGQYTFNGDYGAARQARAAARVLFRDLGNLPMLADNLLGAAAFQYFGGDLAGSLALSEEAAVVSQAGANLWGMASSAQHQGMVHLERGDFGSALALMKQAVRQAVPAGAGATRILGYFYQILIYTLLGTTERALALGRWALDHLVMPMAIGPIHLRAALSLAYLRAGDAAAAAAAVREVQAVLAVEDSFFVLWPQVFVAGDLALARGEYAELIALMDARLAFFRPRGVDVFVPDLLYYKGRALHALHQGADAQAVLADAHALAAAMDKRRLLWLILAAQADLAAARGAPVEAAALRAQAREILAYIADHAGAPDLRAAFLAQLPVRTLLDE